MSKAPEGFKPSKEIIGLAREIVDMADIQATRKVNPRALKHLERGIVEALFELRDALPVEPQDKAEPRTHSDIVNEETMRQLIKAASEGGWRPGVNWMESVCAFLRTGQGMS